MTERAAVAQSSYARARRWVIKPSLVLGLVLLLLAGYANDTAGLPLLTCSWPPP